MSSKCTLITPKLLKQQQDILKSLQRHKISELNISLPKYQSVERVTLFLLVAGSFDLRTGHLAIL